MSDDFAQNSILSSCCRSLYLFLRLWRPCSPEQREHESFCGRANGQLDVLGLLDSILVATLPRYLRRPDRPTLDLQRVRHDWEAWTRQMQPNQRRYARERALVFVEVI